jgi:uncharacterized protein
MSAILAIIAGTSLGYAFERGDMCFHSTLRGLFQAPRQLTLFRAYVLALLISTPLVYVMRIVGWIDPWIPPFPWLANIVGGLIFGVGMVVASSCITGFFYKLGHGMLGILVGLVTWAIGDILVYRGPLSGIRAALTANPLTVAGAIPTVPNVFGSVSIVFGLILAFGAILWLWNAPKTDRQTREKLWGWGPLGIAVGVIISVSWLLAAAGNSNFPFGTSYVPTQIYLWLFEGQSISPWIPITLVSLILGAFVAAKRSGTLWVRGESRRRYLELGAGGFMMGIGAALAGGCNLGHGLVGVPLLSLGSITTVLAMAAGVYLANEGSKFLTRRR